jgi:hypothetical protein
MKGSSNLDEDDLCPPRLQISSLVIRRRLNARWLIAVVLLLIVLFAYGVDSGHVHAASQTIFVPACSPSTDATSTSATTSSPSSLLILLPSQSLSPTPTSSPKQQPIEKWVWHYITLVFDGQCQEAYGMLSPDVRAQEPYIVFLNDMEYTLLPGCWMIGRDSISQLDSRTWNVWIEMTQVSCDNNSPIVFYSWHFRVQVQDDQLVIVRIGLYPAGVAINASTIPMEKTWR